MNLFFFKQKTAYELRISDWSSDVCSSDLGNDQGHGKMVGRLLAPAVVFEASPRYSRAEAPGCAQTCPAPFYAAFQAPGVASGGARGRALRALKQKTGPPDRKSTRLNPSH